MRSFLIVSLITIGCSTRVPHVALGTYSDEGKDHIYTLELRNDQTFTLTLSYWDARSSCDGTWQVLNEKTILLTCSPVKFPAQIQSGYMTNRERNVLVVSLRKLRLDNTNLRLSAN